jgi:hypothetical protein
LVGRAKKSIDDLYSICNGMRLLAARVDGLRSVVGVGWRGCRDLESDFDTSSTHALLVAPPALECPMLSDVRMQLRRSRQNRTFARQDSGQNNCAHPSRDRFRLTIRLCAHPSPSTFVCTIRTPHINPFAIRWTRGSTSDTYTVTDGSLIDCRGRRRFK